LEIICERVSTTGHQGCRVTSCPHDGQCGEDMQEMVITLSGPSSHQVALRNYLTAFSNCLKPNHYHNVCSLT